MSVIENALYRGGRRTGEPSSLGETYQLLRAQPESTRPEMAWIGLAGANGAELASLATEFDLHALAVEDAVVAHQRPKLERYGATLFVVLRAARYVDAVEEVEFSELHVFVGEGFVVTVRHGANPDLGAVRRRMESTPELLSLGPEAVLYAILDRVVDDYGPVVAGLDNDIDEIEAQVFTGAPEVSRRIYELFREVIEFQRSVKPLVGMLSALSAGWDKYGIDDELRRYLRDVQDHVVQVAERVEGFRQLLQNILTVNAALVGQRQNEETRLLTETSVQQSEEVKRISSWAAILFAPTLVGTIYGMNFRDMPELRWQYGYPLAVLAMVLLGLGMYLAFRHRRWL